MDREFYSYRRNPAVPKFPDDKPIIIFDGECVMCSANAQFVMRRDKAKRFRLLAAQSPLGAALYRHYSLNPRDYQTFIVIRDGFPLFRAKAALYVMDQLGAPWSWFGLPLRALPWSWRNALYAWVARNRYRWFGKRETCYVPSPEDRERFLS